MLELKSIRAELSFRPTTEENVSSRGARIPACRVAIRRLARLEGLLLDPVYTGKAFAGLLDLAEKGRLGQNEPIIFLHTGGVPGLFAFGDSLLVNP